MTPAYEARAAVYAADRDREAGVSARISRLRLASFIPGAVCLIWAMTRGMPVPLTIAGIGLLIVFVVLVFWHARVDDRVAWYDALCTFNAQAVARIARAWDRLPNADQPDIAALRDAPPAGGDGSAPVHGPETAGTEEVEHHAYAADLDLFGHASLMQWLGPAATAPGVQTLQRWLLHPAEPRVIRARQLAVIDLAPAAVWREHLGGHGQLAAGVRAAELARFLEWAEGPEVFTPRQLLALRVAVYVITLAIWILLVLDVRDLAGELWLMPMLAGILLSLATAVRLHKTFTRAGAGQHAFLRYAALFAHASAAPDGAPHLRQLHDRLGASGRSASACMRHLNRILGFAQLRASAGIFHFLIHGLTLWDFHVFFALDAWRRRVGGRVRDWMAALGELDALSAFARIKADNPAWAMPDIVETERIYAARNLGHPLIADDRRIGNDVTVGPPGTLVLITGSNMSGKSTLLRAIGLNAVLAQAGAPVCADSLQMAPVDLETSIRVHDSLEHGLSYFMAALARLKGVVDRAQRAAPAGDASVVLYLLDEILQGTNTAERSIAVRAVARHLLTAGAIGVMTTHDLAIAEQEPLSTAATLAHFTEIIDANGKMTFDYRLRPGLATSRNALRLMQLLGIEL